MFYNEEWTIFLLYAILTQIDQKKKNIKDSFEFLNSITAFASFDITYDLVSLKILEQCKFFVFSKTLSNHSKLFVHLKIKAFNYFCVT